MTAAQPTVLPVYYEPATSRLWFRPSPKAKWHGPFADLHSLTQAAIREVAPPFGYEFLDAKEAARDGFKAPASKAA